MAGIWHQKYLLYYFINVLVICKAINQMIKNLATTIYYSVLATVISLTLFVMIARLGLARK